MRKDDLLEYIIASNKERAKENEEIMRVLNKFVEQGDRRNSLFEEYLKCKK